MFKALGLHPVAPDTNPFLTCSQCLFSVVPDLIHKISLGAREGL